jgi:hypothetical protein
MNQMDEMGRCWEALVSLVTKCAGSKLQHVRGLLRLAAGSKQKQALQVLVGPKQRIRCYRSTLFRPQGCEQRIRVRLRDLFGPCCAWLP